MSTLVQLETLAAVSGENRGCNVRRDTFAVLAVALMMRLLVMGFVIWKYPHDWLFSRGIEMGLLAQSVLAGHGLSSPFGGSTGPTAFIAPAYPLLIALIFRLCGSFTLLSAVVIMTLQIIVNLAAILLMMHIARSLFNSRAAILAGAIWAVSLPVIWLPTVFWETSFSVFVLLLLIALALHCERQPSVRLWLCIGLTCGLALLINPALLLAVVAVMGWAACQARSRTLRGPLLGLLTMILTFSPWPVRNACALHAFVPLRSTVGFELWMGNRPGASGFLEESLFPMFNKVELARYVSLGEIGYVSEKKDLALTYAATHPFATLKMSAIRFLRFWSGTGNKSGSPLFALHALVTTCFGAVGFWLLCKRGHWRYAMLLLLPLIVFPVPYYITHAEFRYRLVIDPLLTLLAAYAMAEGIAYATSTSLADETASSTHEPERIHA